jgi:protein TonB
LKKVVNKGKMDKNLRDKYDFNDLLFEYRNKEYGAYQLRKMYNSVVIGGIIVSSVLFSLLVILPFLLTGHSDRIVGGGIRSVQVSMENLGPPEERIFVPPAPPPPAATRVEKIVKYIPPVFADTLIPLNEQLATTDELLAQAIHDPMEIAGTGSVDDLLFGQDGETTDDPFYIVEVMPSFKGGDISTFRLWVQNRTYYPQEAVNKKIRGTVFLTFIVEKDGSVSNVTVIKGVDPLLDSAAVTAISESPKWTPGLQRGRPVRVRFQIPLNFMF